MRTPVTTWPFSPTSTMSECERALSRVFSFVSTLSHRHAHTHRGSSHESCVCHPCHPHVHEVSVSPRPCSHFVLYAFLAALFPLLPALEARRLQHAAHCAHRESMDLSDEFCLSTSRKPRWNPNCKKKKNRGSVVPTHNIVEDDSGTYEVFTEEGSFASKITVGKVTNVIAILPGCDGQAAVAVSAYTSQGKMHQNYWKFPNRNVQTLGFVYRNTNGPIMGHLKNPWSFLKETCTVHPLAGLAWERQFDEVLFGDSMVCTRWSRRTHFISWPLIFGMYSTWMLTDWNFIDEDTELLNDVFLQQQQKITVMTDNPWKSRSVVLRHGRTGSKMRWSILWSGEQESGAISTKFQVFAWVTTNSSRRNSNLLEN